MSNGRYIHGLYGTRINWLWANMRNRCNCPTNKDYGLYGGRGIHVCHEWDKFINFYNWAMSHGYNDTLSIDRIDPNGDYCPENCRWITMEEQQSNKRNNRYIEVHGKRYTMAQASREFGVSLGKLEYRLKCGLKEDDLISKERKRFVPKRRYLYNGKLYSRSEICEKFNINKNTFGNRIFRGWSVEEIVAGKRSS